MGWSIRLCWCSNDGRSRAHTNKWAIYCQHGKDDFYQGSICSWWLEWLLPAWVRTLSQRCFCLKAPWREISAPEEHLWFPRVPERLLLRLGCWRWELLYNRPTEEENNKNSKPSRELYNTRTAIAPLLRTSVYRSAWHKRCSISEFTLFDRTLTATIWLSSQSDEHEIFAHPLQSDDLGVHNNDYLLG